MILQKKIEAKLKQNLLPQHLEIENESHRHSVEPGSESHFKVVVVASEFIGKSLLARHRRVNEILAVELKNQIHALALHTLTPKEWDKAQKAKDSPHCLGGSKKD